MIGERGGCGGDEESLGWGAGETPEGDDMIQELAAELREEDQGVDDKLYLADI